MLIISCIIHLNYNQETSNRFSVLSNVSTIPSIDSFSSPTTLSIPQKRILLSPSSSSSSQSSRQEAAQLPNKKSKQNLRAPVSNCQSICKKRSQFAEAVDYPTVLLSGEGLAQSARGTDYLMQYGQFERYRAETWWLYLKFKIKIKI